MLNSQHHASRAGGRRCSALAKADNCWVQEFSTALLPIYTRLILDLKEDGDQQPDRQKPQCAYDNQNHGGHYVPNSLLFVLAPDSESNPDVGFRKGFSHGPAEVMRAVYLDPLVHPTSDGLC